MSKVFGTLITVTGDQNTYIEPLTVDRALPNNSDVILQQVTEWAEYNWCNSAYWIIPNVMNAIITERKAQIIIPIMSHDGPTGQLETITLAPVRR